MFAIFGNIFSCILWGFLLTVILVFLVYIILRLLSPSFTLSPVSFIIFALLLIFIFAQSFMLVGAINVKSTVNSIGGNIASMIGQVESSTQSVIQQSVELKNDIAEQYPLLSPFLNKVGVVVPDGVNGNVVLDVITEIKSSINYYILRRILWMIGFMAVGVTIIAIAQPKKPNYNYDDDLDLY